MRLEPPELGTKLIDPPLQMAANVSFAIDGLGSTVTLILKSEP
jgi:hypothetical protein